MEKSFFGRPFRLLCLVAAQMITHAAHSLSLLGKVHLIWQGWGGGDEDIETRSLKF